MFFLVPFLIASILGIIMSMVTWWFSKNGYSLFVRMLPGTVLGVFAIICFYVGFAFIRGFEGGVYGILSFFLIIFAIISIIIGRKDYI
ncbi:hypothetical protein [Metabacillus niabensis]|uniref:hypothetical protein n=1 Tax=Metabacillus niabensis TaxID=324854 RepID=UPI001CF9965C|nr:hypothetical protein [Metabacillus niabensis]